MHVFSVACPFHHVHHHDVKHRRYARNGETSKTCKMEENYLLDGWMRMTHRLINQFLKRISTLRPILKIEKKNWRGENEWQQG